MDFSGPAWFRTRMDSGCSSNSSSTSPAVVLEKKDGGNTGHGTLDRRDHATNNTSGSACESHRASSSSIAKPHFAVEFDALHCFETFVIH